MLSIGKNTTPQGGSSPRPVSASLCAQRVIPRNRGRWPHRLFCFRHFAAAVRPLDLPALRAQVSRVNLLVGLLPPLDAAGEVFHVRVAQFRCGLRTGLVGATRGAAAIGHHQRRLVLGQPLGEICFCSLEVDGARNVPARIRRTAVAVNQRDGLIRYRLLEIRQADVRRADFDRLCSRGRLRPAPSLAVADPCAKARPAESAITVVMTPQSIVFIRCSFCGRGHVLFVYDCYQYTRPPSSRQARSIPPGEGANALAVSAAFAIAPQETALPHKPRQTAEGVANATRRPSHIAAGR